MFKKIVDWFKSQEESKKLENWYLVEFDEEKIYRRVSPPGKEAWSDSFYWNDIERICFEAADYMYSDGLYFFTSKRSESYTIPIEAKGGSKLWVEVLERKLFDDDLAIKANTSLGGLFCWPPHDS